MFDTAKFGALVASLRKNADMTQSELADRLGLTRQAISRYECGDSFPDISILREMAGIFGISVELLISAGNPTDGEAQILRTIAEGGEPKEVNAADVANLAPWLKPSILTKLSESMAKNGIGIAHLVALAEYLNDTDTDKLMKVVDFDSLADMDMGLLSRLMPLLGPYAHDTILQKIIDGELDYHYLELVGGYQHYSLIEAAVVYGVLPADALYIVRRQGYTRNRLNKRGLIHLYTCPNCGEKLMHFYPTCCKCGHQICGDGNILHFADESRSLALRDAALPVETLRRMGDRLLILILGANVTPQELAEYYAGGNDQCEIIVLDHDFARLEALWQQLRPMVFIQVALVHDDPAAPHLADGSFNVIIDNTTEQLADGLTVKLTAGGRIIRGGQVVYER